MRSLVAAVGKAVPSSVRQRIPARWKRALRGAGSRTEPDVGTQAATPARAQLVAQAEAATSAERWEDAVAGWEAVLATPPHPGAAREFVRLARAHRQRGDLAAAEAVVREGRRHHPRDVGLRTEDAQLAVAAGDWDRAASAWQALIDAAGDDPDPRNYTRLARAHRRREDLGAAADVLAEGRARFPDHIGIASEHAQLASAERDWPEARQRWAAVIDARGDGAPARAFAQLAKAHQQLGDLTLAAEVVERGRRAHPGDPEIAERHAKLAIAERDWETAARRWRGLIEDHPGVAPPDRYVGLARIHTEAGDHAEADATLRRGLEAHPGAVTLLVELANLAATRSAWDDARARWEEARRAQDDPLPAELQAGFARRCAGGFQHDLADEVLARALAELPDAYALHRQHVRNAITRERRDRAPDDWDWAETLRRARAVAAARPLSTDEVLDLATLLADATALEEAAVIVREAAEADPGRRELRDELAELCMALGWWRDARTTLDAEVATGTTTFRERQLRSRAHQAEADLDAALAVLGDPAPDEELAHLRETARAHAAVGDHAGAAERWAQVRRRHPGEVADRRRLAVALRRAGDREAAAALVRPDGEAPLESNPGVVAIIGGGPSLSGTDLGPLEGVAHCVAVNATAAVLPWCDVAVTHDASHLAERFLGFPGRVVAGVPESLRRSRGTLPGFEFRRRFVTDRLAELDDVVHSGGHTSAHTALNYAYSLQPWRIVLFGIDLTEFWGPDDYWHGTMDPLNRRRFQSLASRPGYDEWHEYRSRKLRNAPAVFASTVPQLERAGIEVLNASPVSSLTCFPKLAPEDGVRRCIEDALA